MSRRPLAVLIVVVASVIVTACADATAPTAKDCGQLQGTHTCS